jgi:hypothetical protein
VILKLMRNNYPSFNEIIQFRNQYNITKNLDISGVIKAYSLEQYANGYVLVMEDYGGISLSHYLNQHSPDNSDHVEKQTRNLTPQPPSLVGKGENSKPLSLQERGMEARFSRFREKSGIMPRSFAATHQTSPQACKRLGQSSMRFFFSSKISNWHRQVVETR